MEYFDYFLKKKKYVGYYPCRSRRVTLTVLFIKKLNIYFDKSQYCEWVGFLYYYFVVVYYIVFYGQGTYIKMNWPKILFDYLIILNSFHCECVQKIYKKNTIDLNRGEFGVLRLNVGIFP